MTYAELLLVFVVAPTVMLSGAIFLTRRFSNRFSHHSQRWDQCAPTTLWPRLAALLALMGVATLYTIPWDDHLIALGVWWYQPALLLGPSIGHIPVEEALFFPLQTLLVGVWWMGLSEWVPSMRGAMRGATRGAMRGATGGRASMERRSGTGRTIVFALGAAVWIGALALVVERWQPGVYLGWELAWALPPLLLQILLGGDILWRRWGLVSLTLVPAALYLSCVDALALHLRIWTIDPRQSLGLLIGGQLPVEELLFFVATSALIGCGLVLGSAPEMGLRARAVWRAVIATSKPDKSNNR